MGTVKGTEGMSPREEKALGTPSPPEGKRLDIFCVPHRAELEPCICYREADSSQRLRSAA